MSYQVYRNPFEESKKTDVFTNSLRNIANSTNEQRFVTLRPGRRIDANLAYDVQWEEHGMAWKVTIYMRSSAQPIVEFVHGKKEALAMVVLVTDKVIDSQDPT